jgi:hypothetical protein
MRYQPQQSVLKPHDGQRQTACIRNISALQRSQSTLSIEGGGVGRVADARAGGAGLGASDIERIIRAGAAKRLARVR